MSESWNVAGGMRSRCSWMGIRLWAKARHLPSVKTVLGERAGKQHTPLVNVLDSQPQPVRILWCLWGMMREHLEVSITRHAGCCEPFTADTAAVAAAAPEKYIRPRMIIIKGTEAKTHHNCFL